MKKVVDTLFCPVCGMKQRGDRTFCIYCGLEFDKS